MTGEFYEEAAGGGSASHHLQVKAPLSLLYHVLVSVNPFAKSRIGSSASREG